MKRLSIVVLMVSVIICCSACSENVSETETTSVVETIIDTTESTTSLPTEQSTTKSKDEIAQDFKEICSEYEYDDITFAPSRYNGLYIKITGYVDKLFNDDGCEFLLRDDNNNYYEITGPYQFYNHNDKVTVYGNITDVGKTKYYKSDVVSITAKYVDYVD